MAERNEQVLDMVRQELNQRSDAGSGELFERAKEMDPSLQGRKLASFHASYVLPIMRERAQQRAQAEGEAQTGAGSTREETRPRQRSRAGTGRGTSQPRRRRAVGGPGAAPEQQGAGRERIRAVFLAFAREFSEAESRTEIVQVLSRVDEYVDRVVQQGR